jgi:drug/metabolite transporter (DMT)-like permease
LLGALASSPLLIVLRGSLSLDRHGLWLAVASGATASGMGYALWYAALPRLSTTRAALAQLLVPVIAAFGGVLLLGEHVTFRLLAASVVVLGALALARSSPPVAKARA